MASLGDRIREMRKRRGWNQTEMAKATGLTLRIVSSIERGESKASAEQLTEICKAFKVSTDFLLTGIDSAAISATDVEILGIVKETPNIYGAVMDVINAKRRLSNII